MNKVVDLRLVEAAKLGQQQQVSKDASQMIELQEARQKLVSDVEKEVTSLTALCRPWTYVEPTLG